MKYFFGSGAALAALDTTRTYAQGPLDSSGSLTVGNFSESVGARTETGNGSRNFRGLVDELRVFNAALDLTQVQEAQLNGTPPPQPVVITAPPANRGIFIGGEAAFTVTHTGTAPFTYQWQRDGADIPGATTETYTLTGATAADDGAEFRVKISNAVSTAGVVSNAAVLTILSETAARVSLSFSEGSAAVTNRGTLGGSGAYAVTNGFPAISGNVPSGPQAPSNNLSSVNFGTIAAGQGSRAIDLTNPVDDTIGTMTAFTVTGWLNCTDLDEGYGGNRIAFALATPGGAGLDLVQTEAGSLRLGVNAWPDAGGGGPVSSPFVTADPENGAANWVFFAVTYDSGLVENQVSYYFGSPSTAAALDMTETYEQGPIETSGPLSVGNFSPIAGARNENGPNGPSRVFRGLIDELNLYGRALTLEEIQAQQKAAAYQPATSTPVAVLQAPQDASVFAGGDATFQVSVDGTPPLTYQWWRRQGGAEAAIPGATGLTYTLTDVPQTASGDQFWVVVSNQVNSVTSSRAALNVLPENNRKIEFTFSEAPGAAATANSGNLGGGGTIVMNGDFPVFSTVAPAGPFAPVNNAGSIDFGTIAEGEGGRAVNLENGLYGAQAGRMEAFTLTGWLNCRDLQAGSGGNRIICAHNFSTDPGFDLVQNTDGTLQLGVNSWPDFPGQGPRSSEMVTADPEAGAENWVFFAVTYDSTVEAGNVNYYFGKPDAAAVMDLTLDYPQGAFDSTGAVTLGNLNTADGARNDTGANSRNFRGLLDELRVFNRVLTFEEIQAQQRNAAAVTPLAVALSIAKDGANIVLTWDSAETLKLQAGATPGGWTDEPTVPAVNGTRSTVTIPADQGKRFYRLAKLP